MGATHVFERYHKKITKVVSSHASFSHGKALVQPLPGLVLFHAIFTPDLIRGYCS
jgi:hypothetical protein